MVKTAVLVSGGGTNLPAVIDARIFGEIPDCELTAVISSNPEAYALKRAEAAGIPAYTVDVRTFPNRASFSNALLQQLKKLNIELVVLAGFMLILEPPFVAEFKNRIINIHPSLIPAFSGAGRFGLKVHEMALEYGVKLSGATAHFVTDECDAGPIISQRAVPILEGDTPKTLQRRVMEQAEWRILPEAIALYCAGRLRVEGRVVRVADDAEQ
jgi:phosphoribosylglycinamide formyltransferase-1